MSRRKSRYERDQVVTATPNVIWIIGLVLVALVAGAALALSLTNQTQSAAEPAPVITATPTITPEATIPIHFRPNASPETQPILTIGLQITDAATGRPVPVRIWAGETLVAENVTAFDVGVRVIEPGVKIVPLQIEADGYHPWQRDVRFKVLYSRRVELPVQLEPLHQPDSAGGA